MMNGDGNDKDNENAVSKIDMENDSFGDERKSLQEFVLQMSKVMVEQAKDMAKFQNDVLNLKGEKDALEQRLDRINRRLSLKDNNKRGSNSATPVKTRRSNRLRTVNLCSDSDSDKRVNTRSDTSLRSRNRRNVRNSKLGNAKVERRSRRLSPRNTIDLCDDSDSDEPIQTTFTMSLRSRNRANVGNSSLGNVKVERRSRRLSPRCTIDLCDESDSDKRVEPMFTMSLRSRNRESTGNSSLGKVETRSRGLNSVTVDLCDESDSDEQVNPVTSTSLRSRSNENTENVKVEKVKYERNARGQFAKVDKKEQNLEEALLDEIKVEPSDEELSEEGNSNEEEGSTEAGNSTEEENSTVEDDSTEEDDFTEEELVGDDDFTEVDLTEKENSTGDEDSTQEEYSSEDDLTEKEDSTEDDSAQEKDLSHDEGELTEADHLSDEKDDKASTSKPVSKKIGMQSGRTHNERKLRRSTRVSRQSERPAKQNGFDGIPLMFTKGSYDILNMNASEFQTNVPSFNQRSCDGAELPKFKKLRKRRNSLPIRQAILTYRDFSPTTRRYCLQEYDRQIALMNEDRIRDMIETHDQIKIIEKKRKRWDLSRRKQKRKEKLRKGESPNKCQNGSKIHLVEGIGMCGLGYPVRAFGIQLPTPEYFEEMLKKEGLR